MRRALGIRHMRRLRGRGSLLAVALLLSIQIATSLHFALVPHSRCAEHGELVHRREAVHAHPTADSRSVSAAVFDEHDEHCQQLAVQQPGAPQPETAATHIYPTNTQVPSTPAPIYAGNIPILRAAPKNSPPCECSA